MIPTKAQVYETTPQIKNRILLALSKLEYNGCFTLRQDSV
jgi:hypothetical protein